jgi:hypothetical protein
MGERPDQIERHIQNQREELGENFSELEEKVKGAFDWRTQFEERPALLLGAAFVGGALLSALLPSSSRITSRVKSRLSAHSDPYSSYTKGEVAHTPASYAAANATNAYSAGRGTSSQQSETWNNLKNAALGLATTRLSEFVDELLPGFTEHYKQASSETAKSSEPFSGTPAPQESWQRPNGGTDYASHS